MKWLRGISYLLLIYGGCGVLFMLIAHFGYSSAMGLGNLPEGSYVPLPYLATIPKYLGVVAVGGLLYYFTRSRAIKKKK